LCKKAPSLFEALTFSTQCSCFISFLFACAKKSQNSPFLCLPLSFPTTKAYASYPIIPKMTILEILNNNEVINLVNFTKNPPFILHDFYLPNESFYSFPSV